MNIPVSRIAALAVAAVAAFLVAVMAQPSVVRVTRAGVIGGKLPVAQHIVGDVTSLGAWVPWLRLTDAKNTRAAPRVGKGAAVTWGGGEARIVEATSLKTRYRIELSGARAEQLWLTVSLDDQGTGLTANLAWESDPRRFSEKLTGLFSDPERRIGPRLEDSLKALREEIAKEEEQRLRRQRELEDRALAAAKAAEIAARTARDQAEFSASIQDLTAGQERTEAVAEKPRRLRPSEMPEGREEREPPPEGRPAR